MCIRNERGRTWRRRRICKRSSTCQEQQERTSRTRPCIGTACSICQSGQGGRRVGEERAWVLGRCLHVVQPTTLHGHGRTCVTWRSSPRTPEGFARLSAESASEMGDARWARLRFPGAREKPFCTLWLGLGAGRSRHVGGLRRRRGLQEPTKGLQRE